MYCYNRSEQLFRVFPCLQLTSIDNESKHTLLRGYIRNSESNPSTTIIL